jgi:hypothetical protein
MGMIVLKALSLLVSVGMVLGLTLRAMGPAGCASDPPAAAQKKAAPAAQPAARPVAAPQPIAPADPGNANRFMGASKAAPVFLPPPAPPEAPAQQAAPPPVKK